MKFIIVFEKVELVLINIRSDMNKMVYEILF